jgi:hypothetical protein
VGDVIYFVNNGEAYNCRVTKINLLSTIFLNLADDQWLSIPNQVMAGKQISNRRRGSMGKSKLGITIDAKTPAHIIASMESRMREWAGNVKGLTILPNSIYVLHDDLQDPYTLRLKIVFTQSTSFQEHAQRFKNLGMFTGEASGTLLLFFPRTIAPHPFLINRYPLFSRLVVYGCLQGSWGDPGEDSAACSA